MSDKHDPVTLAETNRRNEWFDDFGNLVVSADDYDVLAESYERLVVAAWDVCADQTPAALWDATEALRAALPPDAEGGAS